MLRFHFLFLHTCTSWGNILSHPYLQCTSSAASTTALTFPFGATSDIYLMTFQTHFSSAMLTLASGPLLAKHQHATRMCTLQVMGERGQQTLQLTFFLC